MRSPWRLLLGVLCIALIMFSGTIAVTHGHLHDSALHADCGLCVAVHASARIESGAPILLATPVFTHLEPTPPAVLPRSVVQSAHYSRPPPAGSPRS